MKTFKDLEFKTNTGTFGYKTSARMNFNNNYGISVIRILSNGEYFSYTSNENEWEIAVLYNGEITYNTDITDDVIGYLSEDEVTEIMKQIQKL